MYTSYIDILDMSLTVFKLSTSNPAKYSTLNHGTGKTTKCKQLDSYKCGVLTLMPMIKYCSGMKGYLLQ